MKKNLISGVVWVVMFGVIYLMARALPQSVAPYPLLIATVGVVLSLAQLGIFAYRYRAYQKQVAAGTAQVKEEKPAPPEARKRALMAGGFLAAYGVCFGFLGYLISTFVFLFGFIHVFAPEIDGKPKQKKDMILELVIAAAVTLVIYVLFEMILKVRFPKSVLFR